MNRKYVGFFSENNLSMADNGSIKDFLVSTEQIDYSKNTVLKYLERGKKEAVCPKPVYDILTNELISNHFTVFTDGEYVWKSDLAYYVKNYELSLPQDFLDKVLQRQQLF